MKLLKPVRPGWTGRKLPPSQVTPQTPPRAEAVMHTEASSRRAGGRLSREDQRRLGDILQRVYDDVVRQGVPDRFKVLLNELNEDREEEEAQAAAAYGQSEVHARGAGGEDVASDRAMGAKGMDYSRRKGSQR